MQSLTRLQDNSNNSEFRENNFPIPGGLPYIPAHVQRVKQLIYPKQRIASMHSVARPNDIKCICTSDIFLFLFCDFYERQVICDKLDFENPMAMS